MPFKIQLTDHKWTSYNQNQQFNQLILSITYIFQFHPNQGEKKLIKIPNKFLLLINKSNKELTKELHFQHSFIALLFEWKNDSRNVIVQQLSPADQSEFLRSLGSCFIIKLFQFAANKQKKSICELVQQKFESRFDQISMTKATQQILRDLRRGQRISVIFKFSCFLQLLEVFISANIYATINAIFLLISRRISDLMSLVRKFIVATF